MKESKKSEQENTLALLQLLMVGRQEIKDGKFRPAREVFAELDKEFLPKKLRRRASE